MKIYRKHIWAPTAHITFGNNKFVSSGPGLRQQLNTNAVHTYNSNFTMQDFEDMMTEISKHQVKEDRKIYIPIQHTKYFMTEFEKLEHELMFGKPGEMEKKDRIEDLEQFFHKLEQDIINKDTNENIHGSSK